MAQASSALAHPPEPTLALPRSFWKTFVKEYWNRKPTVFRGLFPQHFPTSQDIFQALLSCGERYRAGDFKQLIRFYIEHEPEPGQVPDYSALFSLSRYLPVAGDGTLDAYVARITHQLRGRRFGIVLNNLQTYQWDHWLQMKSFLSGFYEALGVPMSGADSALFMGNYQSTPFGVHKDDLHIFNFIIEGHKVMSMWPFEMLADRPEVPKNIPGMAEQGAIIHLRDKEDEQQLLSQAQFLEAQAGDIYYWPASYWHRAEPSKDLTVSASLGVSFRPPEFVGAAPKHEWPGKLRHAELPDGSKWKVPEAVRRSIGKRGSRPNVLAADRESTAAWVRFLTTGAMEGSPPQDRDAQPLTGQDWVRTHPLRPIVTTALSEGHLLVAANGHSSTLAPSVVVRRRLEKLVATLNTGRPVRVKELEEAFFTKLEGRTFKRSAFQALMNDLLRWRAVRRCEPGQGG
ncbi:cupin domain-containing protein [Pyxidicoccus xibeiensis]|uniref:cupin domain-containing protein n=1 Tax=Pyxidicoccus xibeiensis TaxID=2906759 RepID=UPI0020A7E1B5|nr:cupin domain-containing protein [Pyxidicoccus xibeiensis]MCP3138663.1 cupin domain-containing protein [Pyxidicoccus xibeiensis]